MIDSALPKCHGLLLPSLPERPRRTQNDKREESEKELTLVWVGRREFGVGRHDHSASFGVRGAGEREMQYFMSAIYKIRF